MFPGLFPPPRTDGRTPTDRTAPDRTSSGVDLLRAPEGRTAAVNDADSRRLIITASGGSPITDCGGGGVVRRKYTRAGHRTASETKTTDHPRIAERCRGPNMPCFTDRTLSICTYMNNKTQEEDIHLETDAEEDVKRPLIIFGNFASHLYRTV